MKSNQFNKIFLTVAIVTVVIVSGIFLFRSRTNNPVSQSNSDKVKVTASFYPIQEFARKVGGDRVEVLNITPPGIDPHEYEPTSGDITNVLSSKLFVFQGGDFDPWSSKFAGEASSNNIKTLDVITTAELIQETVADKFGQNIQTVNPHTWLDPILAIKQVESIRDNLIQLDGPGKDKYNQNANEYITQLNQLDNNYQQALSQCRQNRIIVTHDAYSYLATRYSFQTLSIAGLEPNDEPTPGELITLIEAAKESGLKYVFFETQVSDKYAKTVAKEVGATTLTLNTLESPSQQELDGGLNYITAMNDNLTNLKIAMECSNT